MKIGIDLRHVALGESGLSRWVGGALGALFARGGPHTYVLFHTVFNYHLFPALPASATRRTLSVQHYHDELQDQLAYEGDFDLLFRAFPAGVLERFPLSRQIVCVPDWSHEAKPPSLPPAELLQTRRDFRAYQTRGGAIAVPSEEVRQAILADPWGATDAFVMPPGKPDDPHSWEAVADALLAAFERVAGRAAPVGSAPRAALERGSVRVSTPPVVSIVTPSFNQGAFIRQTIDSVLQQDYPYIDYRVVDGGSTDDTVAILKSYGDRVKWLSEKDRGQTHAINKGMALARGEILAYLNSDDLLRPGAVSRVVEHFRAHPGCDLVYGRDAMIDAEGRYVKTYPTAEYSFERLVEQCCISQPAAFWRKRLSDVVGPFDESLHLVMDYDYWMRADRAGCVLEHLPEVLAHTRIHRDAKSSGAGKVEAYQRTFFRELWDISFRHAGYVSSHYVHLWLYTSVFTRSAWAQRHHELINYLCQKWYHHRFRCGWGRWRTFKTLFRDEWLNAARQVIQPGRILNPKRWFRPAPAPRVQLEPDLWLGPELTLPHASGPVRLAGVPARDSVLKVYRGEEEVASVPLRADEPADVCVEAPGAGPLRLSFSDSELLQDGRRVAFKLFGTTLFSEKDAA